MLSSPVPSSSAPEPMPSAARAFAARATIRALAADQDVFETFFASARIGMALADLSGRYVRVNATYAALFEREAEDLIGVHLGEGVAGDGGSVVPRLLGSAAVSERQYVLADGTVRWLLHGVATVLGSDERPAWFAVTAQDITERRRAEQELRDLTAELTERAVRDPLTGLANRTLLEERLRTALARDGRSGASTGALFLDLDGFKDVNDRYGHAVGDAVLRTVAQRLVAAVRPGDTVARLGGDEFVVLVEDASGSGLDALVVRLVAALEAPVQVGALDLDVGVSVGTGLSRAGEQDPQGLLSAADASMYDAKRTRR